MLKIEFGVKLLLAFVALFLFDLAQAASISLSRPLETNAFSSGISPALNSLLRQQLEQRSYHAALTVLNSELEKDPKNLDLMYKKAAIYADTEQFNKALNILEQILALKPQHKEARLLQKRLLELVAALPHNELGFDQDEAYVSDLQGYWSASSLHYYRLTRRGKFGGRINYAHRFGTTAKQYQFEAYPNIEEGINAAFTLGYANTVQILYPNLQYTAEAYFNLPKDFDFSLGQYGQRFIRFNQQQIFTYTGSFGRSFSNYYLWFRPSHFTPVGTQYYELGLRRYFSDANNYLTLRLSAGKLPDLGDLPPFAQMIIMNQKSINLSWQGNLRKNLLAKAGLSYYKQRYPNNLNRNITDGSLGLIYLL